MKYDATTDTLNNVLVTGNVGIGTVNPANTLAVSGGASIGAAYAATAAPTGGLLVQGNVGIGTTISNAFKLAVNGATHVGDGWDPNIYGQLQITRPPTNTDNLGHLSLIRNGNAVWGFGYSNTNTLHICTGKIERNTMKVSITTNNYVGIGTTDPQQPLHVFGYIQSGIPGVSQGALRVVPSNNNAWYDMYNSGGTLIIQGVSQPGYLSYNGSANWAYTSDARLKKNITNMDSKTILERLARLNPVEFLWNSEDESSTKHFGFIAQEVRELFPSLIHERENDSNVPDGISLSLCYTDLIPILTLSIKEIIAENNSLKEMVAQQQADIELMKSKLELA